MSSDDDRVAELMGEGGVSLDPMERAQLDELRALLADPSVWEEPDASLEDRVVAAISDEAAAATRPAKTSFSGLSKARSRRPWLVAIASVGAAAAIALIVAVTVRDTGTSAEHFAVALAPTDLVPDAKGDATLTKTSSGWRIELDATGLPRLDRGRFYQAWLKKGDVLVPIGTFNEGRMVTLWAGVSPKDFTTLTVTQEEADGNPASSGQRVLGGIIGP